MTIGILHKLLLFPYLISIIIVIILSFLIHTVYPFSFLLVDFFFLLLYFYGVCMSLSLLNSYTYNFVFLYEYSLSRLGKYTTTGLKFHRKIFDLLLRF